MEHSAYATTHRAAYRCMMIANKEFLISMPQLTTAQRQYLRRSAHPLTPLVHIGKGGVSEQVVRNIDQALEAHELIKIKLVGGAEDKQALAEEVATATRSVLIGVIGNIVTLYRRQPDPERRQIDLPRP